MDKMEELEHALRLLPSVAAAAKSLADLLPKFKKMKRPHGKRDLQSLAAEVDELKENVEAICKALAPHR
jgi:hypothetical protein